MGLFEEESLWSDYLISGKFRKMKIGSQESFWFTPPFYFVNAFLNSAAFGDEYSEQRIIGGGGGKSDLNHLKNPRTA